MTDSTQNNAEEDPRERFRRLLEEAERAELDATIAFEYNSDDQGIEELSNYRDDLRPLPVELSDTPIPSDMDTKSTQVVTGLDQVEKSLPNRVDEIDVDATMVTSTAYDAEFNDRSTASSSVELPSEPKRKTSRRPIDVKKWMGCFLKMLILAFFGLAIIGIIVGSAMLFWYYSVVSSEDWPDVGELYQRSSHFETTRILDRNGNLLYEIMDPTAGRRSYVSLDEISPYLIAATIATEDKEFFTHPGFDPMAIVRAFWQNMTSGETVSGASTITQQLGKSLFLTPEERAQGTYARKVKEALLATELTRLYSKDEILELYINEIYYGNLAYGIEAASQTYFGISAKNLDLAQSSFLAGLPQLPGVYDIYTNREVTLKRHQDVLVLIYQTSQEQGCIYVSNNPKAICVGAGEAAEAANEIKLYDFKPLNVNIRYPHWVNYVRGKLEEQFDPQTIYRSGFSVYTTIDPGLQDAAEKIVQEQVDLLQDRHATNGALVAIRPSTGEILAMVGSADFYNNSIDGQVNMAISPRQPGSSIKPITYLAAFEKGWTPATLLWDVYSEFPPSGDPNDPRPPYIPVNYDGRYHGPVTVRSALANSYNIPAVKTLQFVGIYDNSGTPDQDGLISIAKRLGIESFTRNDYGLALTLGGGDVTLLELSGAYAVIANGGRRIPPVSITRIEDYQGNEVYKYKLPKGDQVIRLEHAYLISSILSDNQARTPAFGSNSVLNLPFQAASKTGTTNDYRDNWTIGYTPDIVVGAWVGNADYTPMEGTSGLTGAAPIWASFTEAAIQQLTGGNPSSFNKPAGVVERVICSVSGTEPSQWCPSQRTEIFAADQLPQPKGYDLWQKASIDTWTGLLASVECSGFVQNKMALNVHEPWAVKWIKESAEGINWAKQIGFDTPIFFTPKETCKNNDSRPLLEFTSLQDRQLISTSPIKIFAKAGATSHFFQYRLEYGKGADPVDWKLLDKSKKPVNEPEEIYEWDVRDLPAGKVTLRLYLISDNETFAETRIVLDLQVPTLTPTETPTPTETYTPTMTPTSTETPTPTSSPTLTSTVIPTNTLEPSVTPSSTATPTTSPTSESSP